MHFPDFVIEAITATQPRPVTVTNPRGVVVPIVHADVASQLGQHDTNEFYGYDSDVIELKGSASIFNQKR